MPMAEHDERWQLPENAGQSPANKRLAVWPRVADARSLVSLWAGLAVLAAVQMGALDTATTSLEATSSNHSALLPLASAACLGLFLGLLSGLVFGLAYGMRTFIRLVVCVPAFFVITNAFWLVTLNLPVSQLASEVVGGVCASLGIFAFIWLFLRITERRKPACS
jgi:hypothetical protein